MADGTESFEKMWRDLAPLGRSARTGGYFRQPFGSAERECHAWFVEQCESRGLRVQTDPVGNTVGWWGYPGAGGAKAVLTGSHLDSVLDGGAYDGPLGLVSALAAVDRLRERGFVPERPLGIGAFVEEEGSRFGIACLGSRLATGQTSWEQARELRDRDGVSFGDALESVGIEPDPRHVVWTRLREKVGCFLELHVEQGRDLVHREVPVGVASAIWPHGRYRFDFTGEANHAGTTRMEDRKDPMLSYAMTALAANKQARLAGQRATFGRLEVRPNGTNAVPSAVTGWLDARAETAEHLDQLLADIERLAQERAGRDGTGLVVTPESVSGEVRFDADLARRIARQDPSTGSGHRDGPDWPVIPTMAGHDAGVMSTAGVPTAMLFVRNPTGISHSPEEFAPMADCLVGVEALADTIERLAGASTQPTGEGDT
ncbi:MAG TPA: allantoate amidohydrolase [Nocardioidaceae bacterium]|nr:allantoate amidohydrolase [Nocardioidaceae bacterium]